MKLTEFDYQMELMKEDFSQKVRDAFKTKWYCDRFFDVFNLIKSGQALDKNEPKIQHT